jgi:hypothetical protein
VTTADPVLAYVFWHRPAAGADRVLYEELLGAFHAALARARPPGFRRSIAFHVEGAAWLAGAGYEDWYLLEGSHALDPLAAAAVAPPAGAHHDAVAALAGEGAAGLYRLRTGEAALEGADAALWLAKPAGTTYEEFYAGLARWTERPGVGLWGRQLVLGPTPEFCLRGPAPLELPAELEPVATRTRRVWP